jgi:hypothetical protein
VTVNVASAVTSNIWERCGHKREEVAGGWRRLHNEELHKLYASPNIIRVIQSRRVRWAGYVAMGWEVKSWIHLAQDRDQWQYLVNMFGLHMTLLQGVTYAISSTRAT